MSRDNMLPFSGAMRKINARSQTPIVALLVVGVIDLGVMFYGYKQPSAFGTLVGATAIIPYIIYFLITLAYAIRRRTRDSLPGGFNLGRWAWPVIGFVLAYTVLIMVVLSFPSPFHGADKVLGYGLALAALWYFGGLLWRLRSGTAGVRPVEELADAPPQTLLLIRTGLVSRPPPARTAAPAPRRSLARRRRPRARPGRSPRRWPRVPRCRASR